MKAASPSSTRRPRHRPRGRGRVLVVDDSSVVRRILTSLITESPDLVVAGTAANGQLALDQLDALQPDAVTLDLEMPVLDGLAVLDRLETLAPDLPVVILSSHTRRGAAATLEALSKGARDCVLKPDLQSGLAASRERLREELIPRLCQLIHGVSRTESLQEWGRPSATPHRHRSGARPIPSILVVGSSTGGPEALHRFLAGFPASFPLPIVVTQHMPPMFTTMLAERLDAGTTLQVTEARDGEPLRSGRVVLAPGDRHLRVECRGHQLCTVLDDGPRVNSCRPSVDVSFDSAARARGDGVLAVVLTGMGRDGLAGAGAVRAAGGTVLAQDRESSVIWGMPGEVVRAGLAETTGDPDQLRRRVDEIVARAPVGSGVA